MPAFTFGTATFGGVGDFFRAWGNTDVEGAKRLIDICMENGLHFFDTANGYSEGKSEEILGEALVGKRQHALISTKSTIPQGEGPHDYGSSRASIIKNLDASLKRLKTDYIDLYYLHAFDAHTPMEESLRALDDMVTSGKVRYIGCSNFSGWQLAKASAISERYGWSKYVAHQAYYSLAGREFEWELMQAGDDLKISTVVWSPLAAGALSGKFRRDKAAPKEARLAQTTFGVAEPGEPLYRIVDAIDEVVKETGKTASQVVLNWTLSRPTVASLVIGARNEAQLKENFGALGWSLTKEQVAKLDRASETRPVYPYWHQRGFPQLQKTLV